MRKSNRLISFALWSDALLTVVPANKMGSNSATGVIAPVLPTWYVILLSRVLKL